MKAKLIVAGFCTILAGGSCVFAHEGHEHPMSNETVLDDDDMALGQMDSKSTKGVEAGNKICPVSGDKIPAPAEKSAMGEVVQHEYNGKIYNLCCKMCIKDFQKDPEKYSKIADEEVAKTQEEDSK